MLSEENVLHFMWGHKFFIKHILIGTPLTITSLYYSTSEINWYDAGLQAYFSLGALKHVETEYFLSFNTKKLS